MRVYSWCLAGIFVLCAGCSSPEEELEATLMDSLMVEIFIDVHLHNARVELGYGNEGLPLDTLIRRHGISRKDYDRQIAFYAEHPDTYLAVLNKVTELIGQETRFAIDR